MVWSNEKVESIELVEDFSYFALKDKIVCAFELSEMQGVYTEVVNTFNIAMETAALNCNDFDSRILQYENSLNILVGGLLASIQIMGLSGFRDEIFVCIERYCQNYALTKAFQECEEVIKRKIKLLLLFEEKYSDKIDKKIEDLNICLQIFKLACIKIFRLIDDVDGEIKKYNGKSNKKEISDAVCIMIAYNIFVIRGENSGDSEVLETIANKIWYHHKKNIVYNPFMSILLHK